MTLPLKGTVTLAACYIDPSFDLILKRYNARLIIKNNLKKWTDNELL